MVVHQLHGSANLVVRDSTAELLKGDLPDEAGERGANAVVDAISETEVTLGRSIQVEPVRIRKHPLVTTRGRIDQPNPLPGGDLDIVQLHGSGRFSGHAVHRALVSRDLLVEASGSIWVSGNELALRRHLREERKSGRDDRGRVVSMPAPNMTKQRPSTSLALRIPARSARVISLRSIPAARSPAPLRQQIANVLLCLPCSGLSPLRERVVVRSPDEQVTEYALEIR